MVDKKYRRGDCNITESIEFGVSVRETREEWRERKCKGENEREKE